MAQNWVYGDSLKDYCVVFVVLDPEKAKDWASKNKFELESKEFLIDKNRILNGEYNKHQVNPAKTLFFLLLLVPLLLSTGAF